jgi:hypothetical protein
MRKPTKKNYGTKKSTPFPPGRDDINAVAQGPQNISDYGSMTTPILNDSAPLAAKFARKR